MNYSAIHQALKERGFSWRIAAEAIGCTPQHLMNISARRSESQYVAQALAALIDKNVSELFPDIPRYQKNRDTIRKLKVSEARKCLEKADIVISD